jgi:membrane fusion protein, copper/silver efflux system
MITPLPKHRGQNGPIVAMFALVIISAVVVATDPRTEPPPPASARPRAVAATTPPPSSPAAAVADHASGTHLAATGVIGFDGAVTAHVRVPVRGWLVDVKPTGRTVRRGTRFANLYSPEVVLLEQALVAQLRNFTVQAELDHARNRLARLGMPPEVMHQVEVTGRPQGKLPVWAWRDGSVVDKQVVPGLYVEPSRELVTITDPTRLWVIIELPEQDAARVSVGMRARLVIEGQPRPVLAKVGHVSTRVYAGARTVRFQLVNAPRTIKPGAAVKIDLELAST